VTAARPGTVNLELDIQKEHTVSTHDLHDLDRPASRRTWVLTGLSGSS